MINRYSAYGDYADGYCEDWAPSGAALFSGPGATFAPSRKPGYPTFTMSWEQSSSRSSGAETFALAPYVQELLVALPWQGLSGADRVTLATFFGAMNGMASQFTLSNPMIGPDLPVRFATNTLPQIREQGYDRYEVDVQLRVDTNFPAPPSTLAPITITGNRFVCGGAAFFFPIPLRATTGYSIQRPQTLERNSSGGVVIYSKSRLQLLQHQYAMVLDYDGFIRLQAFFFSFTHGPQNRFQWINESGVSRTLRLSNSQITIRQTMYNRYETEINMVEEL